jgi:hypothetical protein
MIHVCLTFHIFRWVSLHFDVFWVHTEFRRGNKATAISRLFLFPFCYLTNNILVK